MNRTLLNSFLQHEGTYFKIITFVDTSLLDMLVVLKHR